MTGHEAPREVDPVRELKVRAEVLHKRLAAGDAQARARLRALHEHRHAEDSALVAFALSVQRKHCLAVVARECGFSSWDHACRVLQSDPREQDFGTLLYKETSAMLNQWFASYEAARAVLDRSEPPPRRVLLAYKRHFFVAEVELVRELGLDPDDADWCAIGWDWARPAVPLARSRLYYKRLAGMRAVP